MSRIRRYLQNKTIENLPGPVTEAVGQAIIKGIDLAVKQRWDNAQRRAQKIEGRSIDERVSATIEDFRRELTLVGAASGAVAAAPGFGTAVAGSALAADLGWFAMRATDLIMTIGAVHGLDDSTTEERRAWVLAILAFGDEAVDRFASLLDDAGVDLVPVSGGPKGRSGRKPDPATADALARINAALAAQVVKKYGVRGSAVAVGELLPFGIGAVVGGAANFAFVHSIGNQARRFFSVDLARRSRRGMVGTDGLIDTNVIER